MQLVAPPEGVQTRNLVDQCPSTFIVCNQGGRWGERPPALDEHTVATLQAVDALLAIGKIEAARVLLSPYLGGDFQC